MKESPEESDPFGDLNYALPERLERFDRMLELSLNLEHPDPPSLELDQMHLLHLIIKVGVHALQHPNFGACQQLLPAPLQPLVPVEPKDATRFRQQHHDLPRSTE